LKRSLSQAVDQNMAVKPTSFSQTADEPTVRMVTTSVARKIGIPNTPTAPNILAGIVKTQKGTLLPSIIVEVRNQEGTPIRAIRTGKLGQFMITTPLPNGIFTLYLEDPQKTFYFDIIEIETKGEILSPLEIFAKTQRDRIKEDLKKKLFGTDNF
jgi:hypothetical protein